MEVLVKLQQDYYRSHCGNVKPGDTWDHFDSYLIKIAEKRNIALMGLETSAKQIEMLNASVEMDWDEVDKEVKDWLKAWDDPDEERERCSFSYAYRSMKLDYQFDETCPEGLMVKGRNEQWMPLLTELLEAKNCFVAVGLFHLTCDCGLIVKLREAGYSVEPITDLR